MKISGRPITTIALLFALIHSGSAALGQSPTEAHVQPQSGSPVDDSHVANSQQAVAPSAVPANVTQPDPFVPAQTPLAGADDGKWRFTLSPYLWLPAQNGSATVKGVTANVDLDLGGTIDLMKEHFNFGLALHAEANHDRLSLLTDVMYMDLEGSREGVVTQQKGNFRQAFVELGAAYAVLDGSESEGGPRLRLEPLVGTRIYVIEGDLSGSLGALDVSDTQAWADVMVGVRGRVDFDRTFALVARGDIAVGGSDFTWNAQGGLDIHFSDGISMQLGYRAMDVDYSDGHGTNQFAYDMLLHGPFLSFTFQF